MGNIKRETPPKISVYSVHFQLKQSLIKTYLLPIYRDISFETIELRFVVGIKKCFIKEAGSKLNYFDCASKNSLVKFEEMINDLITCEARIFMFNYYSVAKSR